MLKKIFFIAATVLTTFSAKAQTDSYLSVKDVSVPLTTSAKIEIELNNPTQVFADFTIGGIELPAGVECVLNGTNPAFTVGERVVGTVLSGWDQETGLPNFMLSASGTPIQGTEGVIVSPEIKVTGDLPVGSKLVGKIIGIMLTDEESLESVFLDDVEFNITVIARPIVSLDETSTTAPEAAENVDVTVKRTINADEWSTIVLPFAMDADQVKAAFGDDVQLADFTGYDAEKDGDEIVGLTINFDAATAIDANHPYVIKVADRVEEFTVESVDIDPEDEPMVNKSTTTRPRKTKKFIGTYVAETEVPELNMFLSENKFWYSDGDVKMKAYRAYFDFTDILTSAEDELYEAPIRFKINDEATGITTVHAAKPTKGVYTLQGVSLGAKDVQSLPKGIYIVNGKKVSVK